MDHGAGIWFFTDYYSWSPGVALAAAIAFGVCPVLTFTGIIGFRKNASLRLSVVVYVHLARGAFVSAAIWHDWWGWQVISGVPAARARGAFRSLAPHRLSLRVMLGLSVTALMVANAKAQDAEPRAYTNTPVGINFLIGGYVYSQGKMAFDPSLSIADAQFHTHTAVLAYVRAVDVWGKSAKFDVILPYSSFSAHGLVSGQPRAREMSGSGDPRFRFSINLFGAPALSVKEFANYRQDLIIGASLQVSAPLGQYDNSKLLNLGNNRWSFRPELGISKAWGPWTVEVAPSITFFTDNIDFYNGSTFTQAPIYLVRGHIIYNFESGVWASLDGTYLAGGRTIVNGVKGDNEQANTRAGLTLALPVDRNNSIKLNASSDGQHDDVANAACGALASVISSSRYLENLLDPHGWLGDGGPVDEPKAEENEREIRITMALNGFTREQAVEHLEQHKMRFKGPSLADHPDVFFQRPASNAAYSDRSKRLSDAWKSG